MNHRGRSATLPPPDPGHALAVPVFGALAVALALGLGVGLCERSPRCAVGLVVGGSLIGAGYLLGSAVRP